MGVQVAVQGFRGSGEAWGALGAITGGDWGQWEEALGRLASQGWARGPCPQGAEGPAMTWGSTGKQGLGVALERGELEGRAGGKGRGREGRRRGDQERARLGKVGDRGDLEARGVMCPRRT